MFTTLCGWAALAHAAEPLPDPLPRDAFVARVLERYPTVAAAAAAVRGAVAARAGAGAPADPRVAWSVAPLSPSTGTLGQTLELSEMVGVSGRRSAEKAMADADRAMAEQDLGQVRDALALEAALAWERWWWVDARIAIDRDHQALARDLEAVAQERAAHALSTRVEVLEVQSELAVLDVELAELAAEREMTRIQLDELLQEPLDAPVPPAAAPADPVPPDHAADRPELAQADARVDAASAGVRGAKAGNVPELELMTSWSTMWMSAPMSWMVGVGSEVPLFWGPRRAAVDQARAAADQAQAERAATASALDRELAEAEAEADRAEAVARLRRERLVPLSRERLDTARIELSSGEAPIEAVLRAERDLLDAEADLVDAESARRAALLSWRRAAAAPLLPETTP